MTITIHLFTERGWPMQSCRASLLTNDLYQSKPKKNKEIRKYCLCRIMWSVYVTTLRFMPKENSCTKYINTENHLLSYFQWGTQKLQKNPKIMR